MLPIFTLRRFDVDCEVGLESFRIILGQLNELIVYENIISGAIGKKKGVGRSVIIVESCLHHLIMWSNACTSSNVANLLLMYSACNSVNLKSAKAFVAHPSVWPTHPHDLTRLERLEILCHEPALREPWMHILPVDFDDEVDVGLVFYL